MPNPTPDRPVKFREIAQFDDEDGVIAVITERLVDGRVSFGFFRCFDRTLPDGSRETSRSAYLAHRHIPAVRRLLVELDRKLEALEDRARARHRMLAEGA